jgi:hypothetical protein
MTTVSNILVPFVLDALGLDASCAVGGHQSDSPVPVSAVQVRVASAAAISFSPGPQVIAENPRASGRIKTDGAHHPGA